MRTHLQQRIAAALVVAALAAIPPAGAASVDLSSTPLVTGSTKAIAPNIFFVLDDSTSMFFEYVPDSVGEDAADNCFKNSSYNKMYYDPSVTYALPVKVDSAGNVTTYPNATFTNAKDDGFCSGGSCGTTNLNTSFRAYRTYGSNYSAPYIHTNNDDTRTAGLLLQLHERHAAGELRHQQQVHEGARCDQLDGGAELRQLVQLLPQADADGQVRHRRGLRRRSTTSTASATPC